MSSSDWITIWGITITLFATMIGSALLVSFKVGGIHEKVISMEKTMENTMADVSTLKYVIAQILVKLDVLWQHHLAKSNSPIGLNEAGERLLEASRIGEFAISNYAEILSKIKALEPQNAYQAQEILISVMSGYQKTKIISSPPHQNNSDNP